MNAVTPGTGPATAAPAVPAAPGDGGEARAAEALRVDTRFSGTRAEPGIRGAILGIGTGNLTPENLITGVRDGIAEELLGYLDRFPVDVRGSRTALVGSGNGIRRNTELQKVFERRLGMEMKVPAHREETSCGAALLAGVACGALPDLAAAGKLIRYLPPGCHGLPWPR